MARKQEQIENEYKAIKKLAPFENILLVKGENPAKAGVPYLAKACDIAKKYFCWQIYDMVVQ